MPIDGCTSVGSYIAPKAPQNCSMGVDLFVVIAYEYYHRQEGLIMSASSGEILELTAALANHVL